MLNDWCSVEGVSWSFTAQNPPTRKHYTTSIDDDNVWWKLFQASCNVSMFRVPPKFSIYDHV